MKIIEDIIEEVNQEIKTKAPYAMRKYQKINSTIRDSLINKIIKEDKSIKQAAQEVNINYSSAKSILNQYRKKKGAQTTNSTENQIRQQEQETDSQQTFDNEQKELQQDLQEPQQQIGSKTVSIENFTSLNKSQNIKHSPNTFDVSVEMSNVNKIQKEKFKQEQKKLKSLNLPQLPALVHKATETEITSKQNYNKILEQISAQNKKLSNDKLNQDINMLNQLPQTSVSTRPQNPQTKTNIQDILSSTTPAVNSTRVIFQPPVFQQNQKTRSAIKAQQQQLLVHNPNQFDLEQIKNYNEYLLASNNQIFPYNQNQIPQFLMKNECKQYAHQPEHQSVAIQKTQNKKTNNSTKQKTQNQSTEKNSKKRKGKQEPTVYKVEEQQIPHKDTSIRIVKSSKVSQKKQDKDFKKIINWFNNHHAENCDPKHLEKHYKIREQEELLEYFIINGEKHKISDLHFKVLKKDKVTSLQLKKQKSKKNRKSLNIVYKLVKHQQPDVSQKNIQKQCEWLKNEHEIITRLTHPNIMTSLGYFQNIVINGQRQCGMLMEEANLDLKKLIWDIEQHKLQKHNLFLSDIKKVFMQIIEPVRYLHSIGLAHNDLKMDNFFAFKINYGGGYKKIDDYMFKLADFEMARHQSQIRSHKDLYQYWKLVNISYSGPEVYELIYLNNQRVFEERKNDIFQLGLILFKMLFKNFKPQVNYGSNQNAPFLHFQNDPIYQNLIVGNTKGFWNCEIADQYFNHYEDVEGKATQTKILQRAKRLKLTIERQFDFYKEVEPEIQNKKIFEQVKDLVCRMLAYNPADRPTIEEINQHPWLQGGKQ